MQQVLELLDGILPDGPWQIRKKTLFKLAAFAAGALECALVGNLAPHPSPAEVLTFGLVTAAAAEFFNSLFKLLVYLKESRKADAAKSLSAAGSLSLESVSRK